MGSGVTPVKESKQSGEDQISDTIQCPVSVIGLQFAQVDTLTYQVGISNSEPCHKLRTAGVSELDCFCPGDRSVSVSSGIGVHETWFELVNSVARHQAMFLGQI